MCCLFGMLDWNHHFSGKQKTRILHVLASAAEVRGTDATGLAYNSRGKLHICKRPIPAHLLRFRIPDDAKIVMGHTRMTTQGDERHNYNNHPFKSRAGSTSFALAHNGVLYNDSLLRKAQQLPRTNIETDSFIAVQLIERQGQVSFSSLKYMSEQLEGSFSFTVLDERDNLYFIKGDNPLCIYYYPGIETYLYASTEEILTAALLRMPYRLGKAVKLNLECGSILRIDSQGRQSQCTFDDSKLFRICHYPYSVWPDPGHVPDTCASPAQKEYIRELKAVAGYYGFSPGYIDSLLTDGFHTDDIEEMIYCGEL